MDDLFGVGSSKVEPACPQADGGSSPTSALHKLLHVQECNPVHVNGLIERLHYSHSVFGITATHCFRVLCGQRTVGGALFGPPAAFNVSRRYSPDGDLLVELRRFVLTDDMPKNSESFCLGVMLRMLKKHGVERVLSYADPAQGHHGTIYAAAGFKCMGKSAARKHLIWNGKKYPDRNIHQINFPYHKELRAALKSGEAVGVLVPGKIIWLRIL